MMAGIKAGSLAGTGCSAIPLLVSAGSKFERKEKTSSTVIIDEVERSPAVVVVEDVKKAVNEWMIDATRLNKISHTCDIDRRD